MTKPVGSAQALLLVGWIFGILVPLASLRRISASYWAPFDRVFDSEVSHVLAHTLLFAVLAFLVASVLTRAERTLGRAMFLALACTAVLGMSQEAIQVACEGLRPGINELFDWCVDVNGGLLGAMIFMRLARKDEKRETDEDHFRESVRCS